MRGTFDFGKLAGEILECVLDTLCDLYPEIQALDDENGLLYTGEDCYKLEEALVNMLSHAGESQGYWCMWFLSQEDIIEAFNELYGGGYGMDKDQERRVVLLFREAFDRKVGWWRDTLADAIEQVMEE